MYLGLAVALATWYNYFIYQFLCFDREGLKGN